MPANQKSRVHRESPNIAGKIRNDLQIAAHQVNLENNWSPWLTQKARRSANRKRQGKTYANWEKKQANASNYKTRGRDKISEFTKDPDRINRTDRDERRLVSN
jgi:hypothetical protein